MRPGIPPGALFSTDVFLASAYNAPPVGRTREGGGGVSEKSIMLVEHDQDQVSVAMRALRKPGIVAEVDEVVIARTGEDARAPEFILLDTKLQARRSTSP